MKPRCSARQMLHAPDVARASLILPYPLIGRLFTTADGTYALCRACSAAYSSSCDVTSWFVGYSRVMRSRLSCFSFVRTCLERKSLFRHCPACLFSDRSRDGSLSFFRGGQGTAPARTVVRYHAVRTPAWRNVQQARQGRARSNPPVLSECFISVQFLYKGDRCSTKKNNLPTSKLAP